MRSGYEDHVLLPALLTLSKHIESEKAAAAVAARVANDQPAAPQALKHRIALCDEDNNNEDEADVAAADEDVAAQHKEGGSH